LSAVGFGPSNAFLSQECSFQIGSQLLVFAVGSLVRWKIDTKRKSKQTKAAKRTKQSHIPFQLNFFMDLLGDVNQ